MSEFISFLKINNIPLNVYPTFFLSIHLVNSHLGCCQNLTTVNNDAMYMSDNLGLYHFWMDSEYRDNIYYFPECGIYVVGAVDNEKLYLYQIIGKEKIELKRVAKAFGDGFFEVVLGYTPTHKEGLAVRLHKEEDCNLFVIGEDLRCISEKQMMFPVLSHA